MKIAVPAAQRGLSVAFIEARDMGGTCLNRGCIPSKLLIYPADLLDLIDRTKRLEMSPVVPPTVDFEALVTHIQQTIGNISEHIAENMEKIEGLDLYRERAVFINNHTLQVGNQQLTAEKIFIASGSRPSIPAIPGLKEVPYITSEGALSQKQLPKRMIIIGAGYIACELGHAYGAYGTETHFIVRSELLRVEDHDMKTIFQSEFSKHHHIHKKCIPLGVTYADNIFTMIVKNTDTGEEYSIEAEALLVATGVEPETDRMGLENTDITLTEDGYIMVDDHLRSPVQGIYALGDCIGHYFFRHSVNVEGEYLVRSALDNQEEKLTYGPVPHAIFTIPEAACVGETEEQLQARQADYVRGTALFADCNMGMARHLDYGMVKLLIDRKTRHILGIHIIGEEAANLLHTPLAFMSMGATLDDMLRMIYVHPALPEILRDAARDAAENM